MTIRGGRGGGVRRLMGKTILNFHFDYLNPPLIITGGNKWSALKSTEVLDLASRQATLGGEMASPRYWFYIATVCNVQL